MKYNADKCEALHIEGKIPKLYMHTKLPLLLRKKIVRLQEMILKKTSASDPAAVKKQIEYLALCKKTRTKPEIFYAAVQNNGLKMCPLYSSSLL